MYNNVTALFKSLRYLKVKIPETINKRIRRYLLKQVGNLNLTNFNLKNLLKIYVLETFVVILMDRYRTNLNTTINLDVLKSFSSYRYIVLNRDTNTVRVR